MNVSNGIATVPLELVLGRLEAVSEQLHALARRNGVTSAEAKRALEARAALGGHLLATDVLLSSGASEASIAALVDRAFDVVAANADLLGYTTSGRTNVSTNPRPTARAEECS